MENINDVDYLFCIIKDLKKQGTWDRVKYVSAEGLIPVIKQHFEGQDQITGIEIGIASGWNMHSFLTEIPNLKLTGIDPFESFVEMRGTDNQLGLVEQATLDRHYYAASKNLEEFGDRASIIRAKSNDVFNTIQNNSIDYVFIDGDHRYEGALSDMVNFYPKVRKGGIFSGHDLHISTVGQAIDKFILDVPELSYTEMRVVRDNVWYWVKP